MEAFSFQALLQWLGQHPEWSGLAVFAVACAESLALVGVLVPGMTFMIGVGTLVGLGVLDFWSVCAWAVAGAVLGDGLSFWLGRHYQSQLRHLWPLSRYPKQVARSEAFVHRYGGMSVLFGRFIGPLRALVPAIAGMLDMSPGRFFAANIVSAVLWAPVSILPGVLFGASLGMASTMTVRLVVLLLILLLILWLVWWLLKLLARRVRPRILRHRPRLLHWIERHGVFTAGISVSAMVLVLMIWLLMYFAPAWRAVEPVLMPVSATAWLEKQWQELPANRAGIFGTSDDVLNLQYAGDTAALETVLQEHGWQRHRDREVMELLHWARPDPVWADLPLWPAFHRGHEDALRFVRATDDPQVIEVLRLWPSGIELVETHQPVWSGALATSRLVRHRFETVSAQTRAPGEEVLKQLAASLGAKFRQQLRAREDGSPLLLLQESVP